MGWVLELGPQASPFELPTLLKTLVFLTSKVSGGAAQRLPFVRSDLFTNSTEICGSVILTLCMFQVLSLTFFGGWSFQDDKT